MIALICGPMFCGKTTEVLRRLERAKIAKKRIVLLRPKTDSRPFLSHSVRNITWLKEEFVEDLKEFDATNFDVIGVDEGQFHKNLSEFCVACSLAGKEVVVSALHATSESEMFDPIIKLIPHCDEIEKLNAICTMCGKEANYTHYLAGPKIDKIAVGGSDSYTALCYECYFREKK